MMKKSMVIMSLNIVLVGLFSAGSQAAENTVEVMLASNLDDARGYCLDIAGGKGIDAPLDKGLQAHTCYHYSGGILEDQGFDETLISKGQFKINYFNVCMSVPSVKKGSAILLSQCNEQDTQKFTLKENGQLVPLADSNLCVTVSSTEQKKGRGGSPVHVMRPLSLQECDTSRVEYQAWTINRLSR